MAHQSINHSFILRLWLAALLLGSCADAVVAPTEGALTIAPPSATAFCTYAPEEWLVRCASIRGDDGRCRALASARRDAERERAALELNLWSSRTGRTLRGLADLHFSHGTRGAWTAARALDSSRERPRDEHVAAAVRDANRAFAQCEDHRVLTAWVRTPVCGASRGPDQSVEGPPDARCIALDGECRRGLYEQADGCCRDVALGAGMVCEEEDDSRDDLGCFEHRWHRGPHGGHHDEARMCNAAGQCVLPGEVPIEERFVGAVTWVEAVRADGSWGVPDAWYQSDGTIDIVVSGEPVASVRADTEGHRTRVASGTSPALGIVALDIAGDDPSVTRALYVPRRASAGADAFEVCVARGRVDDLGALFADCGGGEVVTCPSAAGSSVACDLTAEGLARVSGPGIVVAWERVQATPSSALDAGPRSDAGLAPLAEVISLDIHVLNIDVLTTVGAAALAGNRVPGVVGTCAQPSISCTLPPGRTCNGGRRGIRVCVGGHYGACMAGPREGRAAFDTCNGIDDDCDGRTDEGISASCRDLTSCTTDTCRGALGCENGPAPSFCTNLRLTGSGTRTPNPVTLRSCEVDQCFPRSAGTPSIPANTEVNHATPDLNGCRQIFDNRVCQDGCACNGSERCDRAGAGADAATGCFVPPRFEAVGRVGSGAGNIFHDPCETTFSPMVDLSGPFDGNPCTDETICCEPHPEQCQLLQRGDPAAVAEQRFCGAHDDPATIFCDEVRGEHTGNGDGQTATCLDYRFPGQFASQLVCPPDGNWCTTDTLSCNRASGRCTSAFMPRPAGTDGTNGAGPETFQPLTLCGHTVEAPAGLGAQRTDGQPASSRARRPALPLRESLLRECGL